MRIELYNRTSQSPRLLDHHFPAIGVTAIRFKRLIVVGTISYFQITRLEASICENDSQLHRLY